MFRSPLQRIFRASQREENPSWNVNTAEEASHDIARRSLMGAGNERPRKMAMSEIPAEK